MSSRRPIPPLIFLVILFVVAAGVWVKVLSDDEARETSSAEECAPPPTVSAMDPATVQARVLNATDIGGLGAQAQADLTGRGFVIIATENDRSGRTVTGVGELRHGARGAEQAAYLALYLPNIVLVQDSRADALLDVALGPDYTGLAPTEAVDTALANPTAPTEQACVTGEPTPTLAPTDTAPPPTG